MCVCVQQPRNEKCTVRKLPGRVLQCVCLSGFIYLSCQTDQRFSLGVSLTSSIVVASFLSHLLLYIFLSTCTLYSVEKMQRFAGAYFS